MPSRRERAAGAAPRVRAPAPGPAARGRPRSQKAEQAIFDATLELVLESGMAGFTVEGVAARAGVGKATIYRRWPSKLPLIVNAIATIPELRIPNTGALRGDLRRILADLVAILRTSPLGRILPHLVAERGADPALDRAVAHYLTARREPVVAVVRRGIERGELAPTRDPQVLTDLFVGPIVNRLLFTRQPADGAFIDLVIATVLAGTEPRAARPRRVPSPKR